MLHERSSVLLMSVDVNDPRLSIFQIHEKGLECPSLQHKGSPHPGIALCQLLASLTGPHC